MTSSISQKSFKSITFRFLISEAAFKKLNVKKQKNQTVYDTRRKHHAQKLRINNKI